MEVAALCGANLRSVVEKRMESAEWAMARDHSWSVEEVSRLAILVWRRKTAELKKLKKERESKLKEGSEPEAKKVTDIEEEVKMIGELKLEDRSKPKRKKGKKGKKGNYKMEVPKKEITLDAPKEESGIKTDIEELPVDDDDQKVIDFRRRWIKLWSAECGSFESVTMIRTMPFTYHLGPPQVAYPCDTLQIFSVQVAGLFGGLEFPLDVFGMVAIRDSVDHNRNLVFFRSRDDCQTLTEKDPHLALTGPTRTVVLDWDNNVFIEFELKVRGKVESEDRYLSFLAAPVPAFPGCVCIGSVCFMSKGSLLKLAFAGVTKSVEATIFIRAIEGSWPDGVHGQITALTPVIEHEKLVLLEFGADNVPVGGNGYVELSRQVVSVALGEELLVSYIAWKDGIRVEKNALFKPATAGGSCATLELGTCKLEVLVAWSLVSPEPGATLKWGY